MHDKFSRRIETALERLAARIARSKKRLDPAKVNRQIGRILQQNQRAAARFSIALEPDGCPAGFRLTPAATPHSTTGPRSRKAPIFCVRTSTIGPISNSGRPISSSPRPRPRSAFRKISSTSVRSGISTPTGSGSYPRLLSAFVLWKTLKMWQQRAGLGNSPRTILEELARIQAHDLVLPIAAHAQIRLRCVTQPDAAQAALLDRLGVLLPKRMRLAERGAPQLAATA